MSRCTANKKWRCVIIAGVIAVILCGARHAYALTDEGYRELHVFTKVLHLIEKSYVDSIDEKKAIQGAVRGMLGSLDPHSVYLSPEIYRELKVDTSGRFDGVGLEVTMRDGSITVIAPIQGSPAEEAGVQTGDQIVKIDGRSTEKTDLATAVNLMRGRRGSRVNLTIKRQGVKVPFDVQIVRRKINIPSVKFSAFDERYGYIAILNFQEDTADDIRKALKKLKKQGALEGLIIDVRKNPGGLLDEAVSASNEILTEGVIVTTESRGREIDRFEATAEGDEPTCPIIVLVDGGSASASEILAGALQDNDRALVVGIQTFGKGSVQTVFELGDGSALKLTVARYFTPNGISIQAHGIMPDIVVPAKPAEADEGETVTRRVREADLSGHLEAAPPPRTISSVRMAQIKKLKASGIIERDAALAREGHVGDYQQRVALDFLKYLIAGN